MSRKSVLIILTVLGISSIIACIRLPTVKGIIWIEGHITSDTTWKPIDTYCVINNTYVDPGVTLTIEPGVEIRFGGDFSLIVEGSLYAVGNETSRIVFTSNKLEPAAGDWNTIEFKGNHLVLTYCIMSYATIGTVIKSDGITRIENCEVGMMGAGSAWLHIPMRRRMY